MLASLRLHVLLAALATIAAACVTTAQRPPAAPAPPPDVRWTLTHLGDTPVASFPGTRAPGLQFAADGRVSGFTTCNNFFGRYDAPGAGRLRFAELGSTKMACVDPALAQQEQRFMAALQGVDRFAVNGDTLVLLAGDRAVARFVAGPGR